MLLTSKTGEPLPKNPSTQDTWARRLLFLRIILITVILIGILFWLSSYVIVPILILLVAALVAYAVDPIIDLLNRVMPRALAIVLIYLALIAMFGAFVFFGFQTFIPQITSLAHSVTNFVAPGSHGQDSLLVKLLKSVGLTQSQINAAAKQLQSELSTIAGNIASGLLVVVGGLFNAGFNILITVVVSVYLVIDGSRFGGWLINSSPLSQRGWISTVLGDLQQVVGGYIRGQVIMSVIMGILQGVGMAIIGVPFAFFIGVLAAFMEFVPVIGTITVGLVSVLVALTQGWTVALITLAYTIVLDFVEGYVLSPRVLGGAIKIRPVITLLAMIAGSQVFGIWGAILAAPTAGLIQALVAAFWQYYEKTHPQEFPVEKTEKTPLPREELS